MRRRFQWLYAVGFVYPESGETSFWLVPELNARVFQLLLDAFAAQRRVGARIRLLLVLDQAGWHGEAALEAVPEGITLVPLPAYSPEIQPAEHLWPLTDAAAANRVFESLDELEAVRGVRIRVLGDRREQVRSTTLFDWCSTLENV